MVGGGPVRAGFARRDITPSLGTPSGLSLTLPVQEIWDPLTVTVLVLDADGARIAIAGLDLMGLLEASHRAIREALGAAMGLDAEFVVLNVSHTHSAPYISAEVQELLRPFGLRLMDDDYVALLRDRVVEAAIEAAGRVRPVRVAAARGRVERVAGNRRPRLPDGRVVHRYGRPPADLRALDEGLIDPEVAVVRFDALDDGSPVGALAVYACHPTAAGGSHHHVVSADFVGAGRRIVEKWLDAPLQFLQGCGGNIGTGKWVTDSAEADTRAMGRRLADGIGLALAAARPVDARGLGVAVDRVALAFDPFPEVAELERRLADACGAGDWASIGAIADALVVARRVDELRRPRVSAVALGDLALVVLPGEVFVEHGLAIRTDSPFETTIVAAYDDNTIQYVPTAEAFPDGEYEVNGGWRYIQPGQGERLAASGTDLLRRLAAAQASGGASRAIQPGAGAIT
jgi:hypothetical protein